jgi:hypothetical protein
MNVDSVLWVLVLELVLVLMLVLVLVLQRDSGWTFNIAAVLGDRRVAGGRQEVAAAGALLCAVGRTGQRDRSGFCG